MKEVLSAMRLQITEGVKMLALDVLVGLVGRFDEHAREVWVETVVNEARLTGKIDRCMFYPLVFWRPEDRRLALKEIRTRDITKGSY